MGAAIPKTRRLTVPMDKRIRRIVFVPKWIPPSDPRARGGFAFVFFVVNRVDIVMFNRGLFYSSEYAKHPSSKEFTLQFEQIRFRG
jgi:hypothetical protein